jgi:hypothetical protein
MWSVNTSSAVRATRRSPPTPEEIRRQLGWGMLMPSDLKMGTNRS